MKHSLINYIACLAFLSMWLIFFGCKTPESKCEYEQLCPVDSIQMPDSLPLGQTATLTFLVGIGNGCGQFGRLDVNKDNSLKFNEIRAYAYFKGCVCTDIYGMVWQNYLFTPDQKGKYTIQFTQPNSPNIQKFIQVY